MMTENEIKREELQAHLAETNKRIDELDKQIEAENEPKWGDVKFYNGECSDPVIYLDGHFYNYCHQIPANETASKNAREMPTEFNLFADLKALKEKVTEFKVGNIQVELFSSGTVKITQDLDGVYVGEKSLAGLILGLRQIEAEQKRRQE